MKKFFIFVLSSLSIAPLGVYFIKFHFGLSNISSKWADFGSYVGGVYGAMAFFAVACSIYITGVQFRKQHEDKIFYKSVGDLIESIGRYEKLNGKEDIKSGSAISSIINEFSEELRKQSSHLARTLLCNNPAIIPETNLLNIVYCLPRNSLGRGVEITKNDFLKVLSEFKDFNECWEWLKGPLGGVFAENEQVKNALQAAGSVSFYKTSFDDRVHYCQLAWDTIQKRYDELINWYTSVRLNRTGLLIT